MAYAFTPKGKTLVRANLQPYWRPQPAWFAGSARPFDLNLEQIVGLEQASNIKPASPFRVSNLADRLLIQADNGRTTNPVQDQVHSFVGIQVRRAVEGPEELDTAAKLAQKILPGRREFDRSPAGQIDV